ncbi:MAG: type II toxin-antitoxin system VapB family antitoxin [Parvularculaceae bacterium]|nr:type II toxin-antitoxin system VapB family antitoxin [Parvularculaceae bacterium]
MSALNIKDPEVAAMARKLAKLKGQSITEAVAGALAASLENASADDAARRSARERRVDELLNAIRAEAGGDFPSMRQIDEEMYDENGLPR